MGFKPASNIQGRIFIPEEEDVDARKHACPDCFKCQMCGEERCQVCRHAGPCVAESQAGGEL